MTNQTDFPTLHEAVIVSDVLPVRSRWRTSVLSQSADAWVADENCVAHYYLVPILAKMEKNISDDELPVTSYQTAYGFKLEKRRPNEFEQFYWFKYSGIPYLDLTVDYYGCLPITKVETVMRELAVMPNRLRAKPKLVTEVEKLSCHAAERIKAHRHVSEFGCWNVETDYYVVLVRGFSTGAIYDVFLKPSAENRDDFYRGVNIDERVVAQIKAGGYYGVTIDDDVVERIVELPERYSDIQAIAAIIGADE